MILNYKIYSKYDLLKSLEKISSGKSLESNEIKIENMFKDWEFSQRNLE